MLSQPLAQVLNPTLSLYHVLVESTDNDLLVVVFLLIFRSYIFLAARQWGSGIVVAVLPARFDTPFFLSPPASVFPRLPGRGVDALLEIQHIGSQIAVQTMCEDDEMDLLLFLRLPRLVAVYVRRLAVRLARIFLLLHGQLRLIPQARGVVDDQLDRF